jgi:NAD(P)H-nitrite reductase large subunit
VDLRDGRTLSTDVCIAATGIEPNVEVARTAGLAVRRGVVVNDRMETSDPTIFAAGDVVEHDGRVYGLWPASVDQARIAAMNACGGDLSYVGTMPPARLKVDAIDLLSVGNVFARGEGWRDIRIEDPSKRRYRKLVIEGGQLRGAILVGHPELAEVVSDAVHAARDVDSVVAALERGDWTVLSM